VVVLGGEENGREEKRRERIRSERERKQKLEKEERASHNKDMNYIQNSPHLLPLFNLNFLFSSLRISNLKPYASSPSIHYLLCI